MITAVETVYLGGAPSGEITPGYLVKTTDDGLTWATVKDDFSHRVVGIAVTSSALIVKTILGSNGYFSSSDGGATWTSGYDAGDITTHDNLEAIGDDIYASGFNASSVFKMYHSDDDGASWAAYSVPSGYNEWFWLSPLGLTFGHSTLAQITYKEDEGASYLTLAMPIVGEYSGTIARLIDGRLVVSPVLYSPSGVASAKVYVSNHDWEASGVEWTELTTLATSVNSDPGTYGVRRLWHKNGVLCAEIIEWKTGFGTAYSYYVSTDSGATWTDMVRSTLAQTVYLGGNELMWSDVMDGNGVLSVIAYDSI